MLQKSYCKLSISASVEVETDNEMLLGSPESIDKTVRHEDSGAVYSQDTWVSDWD